MGKVEWSLAPEGATFYANGTFRKLNDSKNVLMWFNHTWNPAPYSQEGLKSHNDYEERPATIVESVTQEKTQWTAKHYDNYYHLTDKDVKEGKVKIDAYFVNKMWKLNEKDDTGALFHCLKTVARFGDKNPVERELNALYNQVKRMAELYEVKLK